jgi:hypothetical protein
MVVRMNAMKTVSPNQYRLTVDVVDPEREHWDYGDCQLQVDLWDEPSHRAEPRGPLGAAFEIYRLSPKEPPVGTNRKAQPPRRARENGGCSMDVRFLPPVTTMWAFLELRSPFSALGDTLPRERPRVGPGAVRESGARERR